MVKLVEEEMEYQEETLRKRNKITRKIRKRRRKGLCSIQNAEKAKFLRRSFGTDTTCGR